MKRFSWNNYFFIFFLMGIFLLTFCGGKNSEEVSDSNRSGDTKKRGNPILKVGDSSYFNEEYEIFVKNTVGEEIDGLSLVSLSRLFDDFIEEKLLLHAAHNQEIFLTQEEKKEYLTKISHGLDSESSDVPLEGNEDRIMSERLLIEKYTYQLVKHIRINEEEIKEYYSLNKREFLRPERVKVSQILLKSEDKAIEVLERMKDTSEESFRKMAQTESMGPEASKSGEMGVYEMGQLPFEIEKVVFSLKEGDLSPVVESTYGFHIFRLDKRYEPELVSEEEAAPEIREEILKKKIAGLISDHIKGLKQSMVWNSYPQNLFFSYHRDDS